VDGWWTGTDAHRARDARRFSARLGIPLENVEPVVPEHATVAALVTELAREREMATVPAAAPAIAEPVATPASVPAAAAPAPEPATDLSPLEMLVEELMRDAARTPEPELASLDTMVEELAGDGAGAPAGTEALEPGAIVAARAPEPAPWEAAAMEAPAAEHPRPLEIQPSGRAPGLDDAPGLAPAPALEGALEPSALMPPPDAPALANAAQDPAQEPVVLEVDPEVRERLRFLVWMRKLRDKTRREVAHVR
jgi:hypothetical protein